MTSYIYPSRGGGVPIYSNVAALPASATQGDLGVTADTGSLYEWNGSAWVIIASSSTGAAITSLTGDVTATGPGAAAATVVTVAGSTAALVHSAELAANAATNLNTVSTIVKRDGSGNFTAGTITATLSGTATNFSGSLAGDVTGTQGATAISAATVTGKAITGFVSGAGSVSATDTILTAVNKLDGNIAGKQASGSYITALTGDATASGPGSAALTLASVVSASTNTKITYNAKGLVTAGAAATLASADFVNQGTTTTVLHGNAAGNPSFGAVSLTADVSGTLPIANGGTNVTTYATGDLLYASATNVLSKLTAGTNGNFLKQGATIPAWSSFTAPTVQTFTSTGTTTGYLFTVTSANATVGATYTNNGNTYTVVATIAAATQLFTTQASAPAGSGTLTKASGTGDATITFSAATTLATYTTAANALYIRVHLVGPGGGGSGSASQIALNGGAGGSPTADATFGAALLVAGKGIGSAAVNGSIDGGAGGSPTINSPALRVFAVSGGAGEGNGSYLGTVGSPGGIGGASFCGGTGTSTGANAGNANAAAANSGGGGGGGNAGGVGTATYSGAGGGAGAFVEALIPSPSATYLYAIPAGGTAGTAGTAGQAGSAGGSAYLQVTEYYQ